MYLSDYHKYPGPIMYEDGSTFEANFLSSSWSYPLNAYLPSQASPNPLEGDDRAYSHPSVFTCPAVPKQWQSSLIGSSNGGWAYVSGYGYNVKGTGWVPGNVQDLGLGPRRLRRAAQSNTPGTILWTFESQVRAPSDMIAIGDGYAEAKHNASLLYPEAPWLSNLGWDDSMGTVHNAGANVLFCDSHVEYRRSKDWIKATEAARKRWNNDNQPHPETWRTGVTPSRL
jgi:prepilin-type processing-associated H-X9-DG protein